MPRPKMRYFIHENVWWSIDEKGWGRLLHELERDRKVPLYIWRFGANELSWIPKNRKRWPELDYPLVWDTEYSKSDAEE